MTITEVDRREAFRAGVRTWLDQHAPAKGSPEDFSAAHVVSARTKDEFEALEHEALEVLGARALVDDDPVVAPFLDRFFFAPGLRIGGGTDEIQRNTIAERGLGLPREPKPTGS